MSGSALTDRIKTWIDAPINGPLSAPEVTYSMKAECISHQDALIGEQLLQKDPSIAASSVDGVMLRAVFVRDRQGAPQVKRFARELHRRLHEAGIYLINAQVHPSQQLRIDRTWHVRALRRGRLFPSSEEAEAIRFGPAELLESGRVLSVPGQPNLRLVDRPQFMAMPAPWWLIMLLSLVILLLASVELAGSDQYLTTGIVVALLMATLAVIWSWLQLLSERKGRSRWARMLLAPTFPAAAYCIGLAHSRTAPGPIEWSRFFGVTLSITIYLGALYLLVRHVGNLRIPGALLLSAATALLGGLVGTGLLVESVAYFYSAGFGAGGLAPEVSGFDAAKLVMVESGSALLVYVLIFVGMILLVRLAGGGHVARSFQLGLGLLLALIAALDILMAAYSSGETARSGRVGGPDGFASCVQIVSGPSYLTDGRTPSVWVMVGEVDGRALLAEPGKNSTKVVSVGGGLSVQAVSPRDGKCG